MVIEPDLTQDIMIDIREYKNHTEYITTNRRSVIIKIIFTNNNKDIQPTFKNEKVAVDTLDEHYKRYTVDCSLQEWIDILKNYNIRIYS